MNNQQTPAFHRTAPLQHFLYVQKVPLLFALGAFLGCLIYFILPFNPGAIFWVTLIALSFALSFLKPWLKTFCLAFVFFFAWSHFTTHQATHRYTPIEEGRYWVTGRIIEMHPSARRIGVVLKDVTVYQSDAKLSSIRISVASSRWPEGLSIGHGVAAEAYLNPPRTPKFWGDFDGRLASFFNAPQAFGYVMGSFDATYIPHAFSGWRRTLADAQYRIQATRFSIAERVAPYSRGLLAALLVGERGYLSDDTWQAFRDSGLAHLLAISGMHLGFFAGGIFFFFRWLIVRLSPRLALYYPVKKLAAGAALFSALCYMLLAGSTIPTIRAFILLAALFGAILVGRQRLILRALALAGTLILFLWPCSAVTPSFQLSFMAAFALGSYFYAHEARERHRFRLNRRARYLPMVLLSSVVAGLMTLPLTVFHFSHASLSGVFVNLFAIPLTAFAIMPSAVATFALLPFGLEEPALFVMSHAVSFLHVLAAWGATWPLNGLHMPPWSAALLAPLSACVLHFFYKEQFRRSCLAFGALLLLIMALPFLSSRPDVYSLSGGQLILKHIEGNRYQQVYPPEEKKLSYNITRLKERFLEGNRLVIDRGASQSCDATGCVFEHENQTLLVSHLDTTLEDCAQADILLTPNSLPKNCSAWTPNLEGTQKLFLKKKEQQPFKPQDARPWHQVHSP